jgi:hypothetical protein
MEFSYSSKLEKLKILILHFIDNASWMTQEELKRHKTTFGCNLCMNNRVLVVTIFKGCNSFVSMIFKFLQRDLHDSCVYCSLSLQQMISFASIQWACKINSTDKVDFHLILLFFSNASLNFWDLRGHSAFRNDAGNKTMHVFLA